MEAVLTCCRAMCRHSLEI